MKVKFMYHKEERDLYAYFPESIRAGIFGTMYECYGQGQHSLCDKRYIEESGEEPKEYEAKKLIKALREIYSDIEII